MNLPTLPYPLEERAELIDRDAIDSFIDTLFSRVPFRPHHHIDVRGIGEKGTDREGKFSEDRWVQPAIWEDPEGVLLTEVKQHATHFAQWNTATYIVPAILKEQRGVSEAVCLFPAAVVDLDTGDTVAKASYLDQHLGKPTIAVRSGGVTEAGKPKLHLYWVFEEPSDDIAAVVELRHELARKVGGDLQFGRGTPSNPLGRAHQPIRIPGTVHSKNNEPRTTQLIYADGPCHDAAVLAEAVRRMPDSPWALEATSVAMDFSMFGPDMNLRQTGGVSLVDDVHEGGIDKTRWSQFNQVAGHHIACARRSEISIEEAFGFTNGWVLSHMIPPWPEARVQREFNALVAVDEQRHGVMPAEAATAPKTTVTNAELGLRQYRVANWATGDQPARKFLVDGLILAGKPTLLVAEGGAGKTFAALDLAMKIATKEDGEDVRWLGQPVSCDTGTTVMLTTEDDMDELHIRINDIDPEGRRYAAGDRWIVVPAVNTDRGPFTFGDRDKATGNVVPSGGWREFVGWLEKLPNLRLVVVDTLNTTLHGDENSATVINEYAKLLSPVCGKLGAALLLTHHTRKHDAQFPIRTAEDMAAATRGSSALPAAFRAVLGIWHAPDFGKLMQAMGLPPKKKQLWKFAVLKANNPEMMEGERYLLRNKIGLLEDVTDRLSTGTRSEESQRRAWLLAAVKAASEAGVPFRMSGKNSSYGLYGRKNELHPMLREGARTALPPLVDELVNAGELVTPTVEFMLTTGGAKRYTVLDVKHGRYTGKNPDRVDDAATWEAPDWEAAYRYDDATARVVPAKAPRMVIGGV